MERKRVQVQTQQEKTQPVNKPMETVGQDSWSHLRISDGNLLPFQIDPVSPFSG